MRLGRNWGPLLAPLQQEGKVMMDVSSAVRMTPSAKIWDGIVSRWLTGSLSNFQDVIRFPDSMQNHDGSVRT